MPRHKKKWANRDRHATNPSQRPNAPALAADPTMRTDAVRDGWIRMKLSAELLEDAHLGSGSGGAGIDALLSRDRHERPVIWASHVEGVLRDAARRLRGEEIAGGFFGRAGGQQQRAVFTSLYTESAPRSRIWRSTARAAFYNRAPKGETLRVVEYVPRGTRFEGLVELPANDLSLLRRLLQEVDGLGRGRATGAGRVKLSLTETTISPRPVGSVTTGRLVLVLCNLDPLCITETATPDNLIPSLAFVPGRALVGTLASWLIAEGGQDVATLLVNGRMSVSDALPIPHAPEMLSDAEVLAAPLSLQSEKPEGATGPVPWWAQDPAAVRRLDSRSPEAQELQLKRPEDDLFVYRSAPSESWLPFRPQLRVRLRNGRPDPEKADPALFAIEQIVEETLFLCEIRGTPEDMHRLADGLRPILEGSRWLRVGRAGAPVEVAQLSWSEEPSPATPSSSAILTLTSDLLVRDEHLRWCTSLDGTRLQQLPGWPADVRLSAVVQDTVAVHGFNGTSRLWRIPAYGVRRGSVFRVEGEGVTKLARMIAEGKWLGERTHEGFGRFRLDDTLPGVGDSTATPTTSTVRADDEHEEAIAKTTHQWFQDHRALAKIGGSADRRPSLSQWFDLVSDLERNEPTALTSRQNPTTIGGKSWSHPDAREILKLLAALPGAARSAHARPFVRWLRAKMREENS